MFIPFKRIIVYKILLFSQSADYINRTSDVPVLNYLLS